MSDFPLKIDKINETLSLTRRIDTDDQCQVLLLQELYRLQSQLPQEKPYLLHHAIRCNVGYKVTEMMDYLDSVDDETKFYKIIPQDPKTGKSPLQLALDFPSESCSAFLDRVVPLLIDLAKNPKFNYRDEFKESCMIVAELLFSSYAEVLRSDEAKEAEEAKETKTHQLYMLTFFTLAGDKANAQLKIYAYQTYIPRISVGLFLIRPYI